MAEELRRAATAGSLIRAVWPRFAAAETAQRTHGSDLAELQRIGVGMGGLNFQIEHHLFPSMPSINLRKASGIVRAYCPELGIPYTSTTLLRSWLIVVQYLHRVRLRVADPFDCPAARALRSA